MRSRTCSVARVHGWQALFAAFAAKEIQIKSERTKRMALEKK